MPILHAVTLNIESVLVWHWLGNGCWPVVQVLDAAFSLLQRTSWQHVVSQSAAMVLGKPCRHCRTGVLQMRIASVRSVPLIDNRLLCLSLFVVVMMQAAGRPVHHTAFTRGAADGSLLFNPFDMQLKNVANTGVLHWGNKLLALYEVRRVQPHCNG